MKLVRCRTDLEVSVICIVEKIKLTVAVILCLCIIPVLQVRPKSKLLGPLHQRCLKLRAFQVWSKGRIDSAMHQVQVSYTPAVCRRVYDHC